MGRIFLMQIKSSSIIKEGKKAMLIPMEVELEDIKNHTKEELNNALIRDAIKLYPQYTKIEDRPTFTISRLTKKEYKEWAKTNVLRQQSMMKGV